ncbi:MAG TPA: enoyl-CoA hydratase/isomerase family protein [Deltaproteobacteria bacterium]|nr:enoyl-CoA hydratase/isomerase family protein [Deltaproteobacteria bacterium]
MSVYGFRLEHHDKVAVVILDRPERRNAFDETMWSDMERVTAQLAQSLPRAIVVTGAGKAFCAGFDVNPDNPQVSGLIGAVEKRHRPPVEALINRLQAAVDGLVSLPVPVIAAINGDAFGGGAELASRCDLRVMDPAARICFSEARLGLMPDWGGGPGLTKLIGASAAADLILTGRRVGADEALRLGLVNRVSAPGQALEEAIDLAAAIAKNGPRAVRHALAVIRRVRELPMREALELERSQAVELICSGECLHGITAFLAKQEPVFPDIPSDDRLTTGPE